MGFSPFEVCLGFQPTYPTYRPLTLDPQGTTHQQQEQHSTHPFLHQLEQRHTAVTTTLKASQDRAN